MKSLFPRCLGQKCGLAHRPRSQQLRIHRPRVEALERRLLLTVNYNDFANIGGLDSAGNVYVLGSYHQSVDLDPGPGTSWTPSSPVQPGQFLAKYGPDMTLQWARTGSQLPAGFVAESMAVYQDPSTGQTVIYVDGGNVVAKYDTAGNLLQSWNTALLYHIVVGTDGSLYGIGSFSGTIDLDPAHVSPGDTLTANGQDVYLDKWDPNGNFQWAQQIGGPGNEWQEGLAMQNGVLYVTGMFTGTLSPTGFTDAGVVGQSSSQDGFLLAYDSSGNFLAGDQFVDLYTTGVAVDSGGIYLAGEFTYTDADADPGPGQYTLPGNPNGGSIVCSVKLNLNADGTLAPSIGPMRWAARAPRATSLSTAAMCTSRAAFPIRWISIPIPTCRTT